MAFLGEPIKILLISAIILQVFLAPENEARSLVKPNRTKRFIAGLGQYFGGLNEVDSNSLDDDQQDYYRKRRQNFPDFPEDDDYKYYDSTTTTRKTPAYESQPIPDYRTTSSSISYEYYPDWTTTEASIRENVKQHFNKRVLPWINNAWGSTKDFFKKHYNTVSEQYLGK